MAALNKDFIQILMIRASPDLRQSILIQGVAILMILHTLITGRLLYLATHICRELQK